MSAPIDSQPATIRKYPQRAQCCARALPFGLPCHRRISAILNILALTGSMFMMEVYDRVLPSRSVPTLVGLLALALILYVFQGLMDALRGRLLVRIGIGLDQEMSDRVYATVMRLPIQAPKRGKSIQPLRDLDTVRSLSVGPRTDSFLRFALGAALSRDLLCLPLLDRRHGAGGRTGTGFADAAVGTACKKVGARRQSHRQPARAAGGDEPSKCRGPDGARHDRVDFRAAGSH